MFGSLAASTAARSFSFASCGIVELISLGEPPSSPLSCTTSSTCPRRVKTVFVRLRSTVSPVVKAAEMIKVLSMRPTTMSTVRATRRGMFLTPMRNMTRLRTTT